MCHDNIITKRRSHEIAHILYLYYSRISKKISALKYLPFQRKNDINRKFVVTSLMLSLPHGIYTDKIS